MSVTCKVPELRFSEFSGDWEEKKLGNIATFYNSKRVPLTETDRKQGDYPYYGASGIIDYVENYLFDGEYILLGEDGANIVLRNSRLVFLATGKFWVNNHAHVFQSKESNYFLCEALERINYTIYNTGTAQPKLNSDVVKKIHLEIPSKQEQEKIASFLSSVDSHIEQLTKKEQLLREYKKGVMQKIFSQELRFHPKGISSQAQGNDDNGNEFPEWVEKKLGEIGFFTKGKGISKNDIVENGNLECIRYGELYTDYKEIISKTISKTNEKFGNLVFSRANDVIIPSSGETTLDIATASCVLKDNIALGGDLNIIRTKENGVFLSYYLNNEKKYDIAKLAQGSSVVHLYSTHLKTLKINLPSIKEQTKIANFLSSLDTKIEQVSKELNLTKEFKKALLQKMFV